MAMWSVITSGDLVTPSRIDADYFRPIFLSTRKKLKHCKPLFLFTLKISHPAEFKRKYVDQGWCVLRAQNIRPLSIDTDSNSVFLPDSIASKLKNNQVQYGDILITRTGANYGQTALYTKECPKAVVTSHTLIVRTNYLLPPAYLALYLNTSIGRLLIDQGMYGSTHQEIAPRFLRDIPIPRFSSNIEKELSDVVIMAYELKKQSKDIYIQSQRLLEQELGLDKIKKDTRLTNEIKLSEVVSVHRFDSQCFKPEHLQYDLALRKRKNFVPLHEVIYSFDKGQQQSITERGNIEYASIKDIANGEIIATSKCCSSSNITYADRNDLLLAITGATIGKIGINFRHDKLAFCGDLLSLKTRETINPYYLIRILDSDIAQTQFQRWITGSTNGHLSPMDVAKVIIPRLMPSTEEKIADWVQQSISCRKDSEQLLLQAKERVEELIEQGIN